MAKKLDNLYRIQKKDIRRADMTFWRILVIWAFAYLFYRHRQRPWKVLLHRKTQGVK